MKKPVIDTCTEEKLLREVWSKPVYYKLAHQGSLEVDHPAMRKLKELGNDAEKILDVGCGDGTRLSYICSKNQQGIGIDLSSLAIKTAKRNYQRNNLKFYQTDLNILHEDQFDLIYSAYVLEHLTQNPNNFIKTMISKLSDQGVLFLIAPNYGSPNRCSPPFQGSRAKKLLLGMIKDYLSLFIPENTLSWNKVTPIARNKKYKMDWDTTYEPYLLSLKRYLELAGMEVLTESSCWSEELINPKPAQIIFRFLGEKGIFPLNFWGPHFFIAAQKSAINR